MNLPRISQSTSGAIKNHSGVKTCRVAETRAQHSPQRKEQNQITVLSEFSKYCCTSEPFKVTQEEKRLNLRWWVTFAYHSNGNSLYSTEVVRSISNPYGVQDSKLKNYKTWWKHSQDAVYWIHFGRAQEKGIAFWQTKIACNHCIQHGTTKLYRTSDLTTRRNDHLPSKSIEKELKQEGVFNVFSEASKRAINELGNIELARTWRNSQNNSVSYMLATFRRDSLLLVW